MGRLKHWLFMKITHNLSVHKHGSCALIDAFRQKNTLAGNRQNFEGAAVTTRARARAGPLARGTPLPLPRRCTPPRTRREEAKAPVRCAQVELVWLD